jgi:alanine racemase
MISTQSYRCWAEIERSALVHNASAAHERVGRNVDLLAVVKANGYGHGAIEVAQALADQTQLFGVANLDEAIELRTAGIETPIVILGPALPSEQREIVERGFIVSVSNFAEADQFSRVAGSKAASINLVIDTGMGRMGTWEDDAVEVLERIAALANLKIHSISTHLPVADEDAVFTRAELARFDELVRRLRLRVPGSYKVHVLLSAGILAFHEQPFEIVRAGLMLYGSSPLPEFQSLLRPALTLKSRVVLLRDVPAGRAISYGRTFTTSQAMRVATLSVGYADGYPRSLSNNGAAILIGGRRRAVLGRVTMDMIMVNVSGVDRVEVGDEAVLIGRQGNEEIFAAEVAQRAGTIAWEIFTGIGTRVRRVYL